VRRRAHELSHLGKKRTLLWGAGNGDPVSAPESEKSLVTEEVQRTEPVFLFTPMTAARSLASGSLSPGPASPSAIAR